jgi:hypothetical protein
MPQNISSRMIAHLGGIVIEHYEMRQSHRRKDVIYLFVDCSSACAVCNGPGYNPRAFTESASMKEANVKWRLIVNHGISRISTCTAAQAH